MNDVFSTFTATLTMLTTMFTTSTSTSASAKNPAGRRRAAAASRASSPAGECTKPATLYRDFFLVFFSPFRCSFLRYKRDVFYLIPVVDERWRYAREGGTIRYDTSAAAPASPPSRSRFYFFVFSASS